MQWANAQAYERFMGRWSQIAGHKFLTWLCLPVRQRWLEVGCGTGSFSQAILEASRPEELVCLDPSEELLSEARGRFGKGQVIVLPGDAMCLPFGEPSFDVAVSGLVLNFVPDERRMVSEMKRVVRNGGCIASYVWDFHGGRSVTQHIGQALGELDPMHVEAALAAQRAETTSLAALTRLFEDNGLVSVRTTSADVEICFGSFEEYWLSNTAFASPHARQLAVLDPVDRAEVRDRVRASLPYSSDGKIEYIAKINCVQGRVWT